MAGRFGKRAAFEYGPIRGARSRSFARAKGREALAAAAAEMPQRRQVSEVPSGQK